MKTMNIFLTLNENYLPQLSVMLTSLYINNPGEKFNIYIAHKGIADKRLCSIGKVLSGFGYGFFPILVNSSHFIGLPTNKHHPQETYYKLFAAQLLPKNIDKALYLDPDLLVINPLKSLYEMDMGSKAFAAASHLQKKAFFTPQSIPNKTVTFNSSGILNSADLNCQWQNAAAPVSLYSADKNMEIKDYNSGVVLINMPIARREIDSEYIIKFLNQHSQNLLPPESDILGLMYGNKIICIDSLIWNYNAKNYTVYLSENENIIDTSWIMKNTSIIHFCGNNKPWKDIYRHRFGLLYKHYMQVASRFFPD